MKDILITIVIVIIGFETIEHIVAPLIALAVRRGRPRRRGAGSLIGLTAEVREWSGAEGMVFVRGELWKASCGEPLQPGAKAVVREVRGLTLSVEPLDRGARS